MFGILTTKTAERSRYLLLAVIGTVCVVYFCLHNDLRLRPDVKPASSATSQAPKERERLKMVNVREFLKDHVGYTRLSVFERSRVNRNGIKERYAWILRAYDLCACTYALL